MKTEAIRCYLIVPIFGEPFKHGEYGWPPFYSIDGWRSQLTGEEKRHCQDFGVGAMWLAKWYPPNITWENETEPHLMVRVPNGFDEVGGKQQTRDWDIDSRCSNCALPDDRVHRCWVRHGDAPMITVDKQGLTCNAGAGSIAMPRWHGFLDKGYLVESR